MPLQNDFGLREENIVLAHILNGHNLLLCLYSLL